MHGAGGGQHQGGFLGSMHSSGMPGGMAGVPHGGGGGGGAQMGGWAGMNPAAARAMLLAQTAGPALGQRAAAAVSGLAHRCLLHSIS